MKKKKIAKVSFYKFFKQFPDEKAAREYFEKQVWGKIGRYCPHCGSIRTSETKSHKSMPYRCKDCRKHFSIRTNTVLAESRIPLHKWLLAIFLLATNLKGVSSCKLLARDLDVTQKTAWFLGHRIRKAQEDQLKARLESPVEADETYIGGRDRNKHGNKKTGEMWRDHKTPVVAVKSRATKKVKARVTKPISSMTLQGMIEEAVKKGSTVYTDQHRGYIGLKHKGYNHEFVNHGAREYVRNQVYTQGIESFWSMLKRGYVGVYHHMSERHLQRYVDEYVARHNSRENSTMKTISTTVKSMLGKRLTYEELTDETLNL